MVKAYEALGFEPIQTSVKSADTDYSTLGFEPIEKQNYSSLGFEPIQRARTEIGPATTPFPKREVKPEKADFDFSVNRMADQIFTHTTGLTPEQGIQGQKKLQKAIGIPVSVALMGPLYALGFETLNQTKNAVVSSAKGEKYSALDNKMLSELIPDDTNKIVKGSAYVAEVLSDIALISAAGSLAKQGLLKDTLSTMGKKLAKAGYGEGKMTITKEAIKKVAKGTTLEQEASMWIKTKTIDIAPKGGQVIPKVEIPFQPIVKAPVAPVKPITPVKTPPEKPVVARTPTEKAVVEPKVMTEEEYLSSKGAPFMGGAEPALHRTPGGFPKGVREKFTGNVQGKMRKNNELREELRKEYAEKVKQGEIRPPTRTEKLLEVAKGDKNLDSTKAAIRLLKKQGIDLDKPTQQGKGEVEKQPWEMMFDEFKETQRKGTEVVYVKSTRKLHLENIKQALADGKEVPKEVLKDYPELAKTPEKAGEKPKVVDPTMEVLPEEGYTKLGAMTEAEYDALPHDKKPIITHDRAGIPTLVKRVMFYKQALERGIVTKPTLAKPKATFKIRKDADVWRVPITAPGMDEKTPPKFKTITTAKVQQIYQDTLTDIEFSEEGDFIVIKGYPKEKLTAKEKKSFSQYGSVGETVEGIPQQPKTVELKPIETIEMVRLAKDLMGKAPITRKYPSSYGKFYPGEEGTIGINRELFKRGNEEQLASTLAHEIGHLVDYVPEKTLKRGNMYGHLLSLRKYLKNTFGENVVTNKELREELKALSKKWKPFDEGKVSKAFASYRNSSVELYADFVSVLFNNPGLAKKLAPEAFSKFFEGLDKKLMAKMAYFDIQDLLSGTPAEIIERREMDIREMFVKGEELREQKRKEKELAKVNYWERIRQLVDDVNYPIIAKRRLAESKGQFLPPSESPEYQLEERSLVDNDNYTMMGELDLKVNKELTAVGLTDDDLGIYLFLNRIIGRPELPLQGDLQTPIEEFSPFTEEEVQQMSKKFFDVPGRKDIANPLGFSPKTAAIQMKSFADKIGSEKFAAVERIARNFQEIMWPMIEEAVKVGSFNKTTFNEIIKPNKGFYVSFGVLNYLQNHVPATVKMQKGTLQDIENPFITTILKMTSLNRLNARQRAVNQLRDWLQGSFPGEIIKPKKDMKGNFIKPGYDSGRSLIHLLEDGKLAAYEVDQYIAKSVENSKNGDVMLVGHLINKVFGNQIFKNLYITYNPGFAFAFNPIRDFKRTYANLNAMGQKTSILKMLTTYAQSLPASIRRQRGIKDSTITEMLKTYALDIPFIDFNFDIHGDDYHGILKHLGILKGEEHQYQRLMKPLLRPLLILMEGIRFAGSTLESLSKIAGYNILKNDPSLGAKQIAYMTRNYIGTPNYRRGGTITPVTNSTWMFSNIMKEGIKSDLQLATHPKTRSGFWWSHFKINILPKFFMVAGATGLLGKEIKDHFDSMSEYDKTNYITIPVGKDKNDKTVYFRIPHDETGRLMAAIFWKTAMGIHDKEPKQLQQIFAFGAGQMPSLAPGIAMSGAWIQYLTGKNPYDAFRGQYLISDTVWKAGDKPALKKMVQWTANNSGLIQFATYDDSNKSTFEAITRATPVLNRLLKVSSYGKTESLRKIREGIDKKQAQTTLNKREYVGKAIERLDKGESLYTISKDIASKLYDRPTQIQLKNISIDIKQEKERGLNAYIDVLSTARTNEEKVLILREMRQMYDKSKMRELELKILKIKAASPAVIRKSRK